MLTVYVTQDFNQKSCQTFKNFGIFHSYKQWFPRKFRIGTHLFPLSDESYLLKTTIEGIQVGYHSMCSDENLDVYSKSYKTSIN